MLNIWKQVFGESQVLMDYDDPPVNPASDFIIDPVSWHTRRPTYLPELTQVVHGHFRPEKYDLIKNAFRLTILRHPVDNLISIYFYWKKIPPQPNAVHQYFLANNLDILGLARLPIMQNLYNYTYFGGWDMRCMDFIIKHENRVDDLQHLSAMLGIKIDTTLHLNATDPDNVNQEKEELIADEGLMSCLRDLLSEDICFYYRYTERD